MINSAGPERAVEPSRLGGDTLIQPIERLVEHLVFENPYVRVFDDEVRFADGSLGSYLRICGPGEAAGVVIVARHQGRVALVRTFRYPIGEHQWAFPRGFAHGPDLESTARAELREELGTEATTIKIIGYITPDSGLMASRVAVVLADAVSDREAPVDDLEVEEVRWVTTGELSRMLLDGAVEDSFTLAAFALVSVAGPGSPAEGA
jgi:8-oxo-dGTP pyrophosphatase MutT (NUDIX family)